MEIRELNETQYLQTMGDKMVNITKIAQPIVDLWDYAECLLQKGLLSEYGYRRELIEAVYENPAQTYQHILLFGNGKNIYIVVVVDMVSRIIFGYYILDLNEKYGLN